MMLKRIVKEIIGDGGDAVAIKADVSQRQEVKYMVADVCKKYGTINVLVNNAVRDALPVPFKELIWDDLQRDIDVIIKGTFNCCQEVIPLMLENKGGKIINISTQYVENPTPGQFKYVVSKSALTGLTRSLAVEFARQNIQVNMVMPSIVKTDLSKHVSNIFLEGMRQATPMARIATPADVAKTVVFLASSLSSFTTGQKIMVTGGNPPFL
jgi:3-oxoacyl-[acyl-carrier protein] reductase